MALLQCPPEGATYRGLQFAMGLQSQSGARQAVRTAKEFDLVKVIHVGDGRGGKAVVRLTCTARTILSGLPALKPELS